MGFKDIFKKPEGKGPRVVEVKAKKTKASAPAEVYDFSYNECRFGKRTDTGAFIKTYPVPKSLYGFFSFETEEITPEEYEMWRDCMANPLRYIITVEALGRGMKKYTISLKKEHE